MKRSEVNLIMRNADEFIRSFGFLLPAFRVLEPGQFRRRKAAAAGVLAVDSAGT
jgi:D-lyxose ketol-isomerase